MIQHSRKQNRLHVGCSNGERNDTSIVAGTLAKWLIVLALIAGPLFFSGCVPAYASTASDARQGAETIMRQYKSAHPTCEACGARETLLHRLEVHHIIPVSVAPDRAGDPNNMITLCRPCHIALGHCGDYTCHRYCPNLRRVLAVRVVAGGVE